MPPDTDEGLLRGIGAATLFLRARILNLSEQLVSFLVLEWTLTEKLPIGTSKCTPMAFSKRHRARQPRSTEIASDRRLERWLLDLDPIDRQMHRKSARIRHKIWLGEHKGDGTTACRHRSNRMLRSRLFPLLLKGN